MKGRRSARNLARSLALASVLALLCGLWWAQSRFLPAEEGDLSETVREIVEATPGRGEGAYATPSREEADAFAALAAAMEAGDLRTAKRRAHALDYRLVRFEDRATGRRLLLAREEAQPDERPRRGWGTIVADPEGADVIVEVAHPESDIETPQVGVALFRTTGARALLVAGAHRDAFDDGRSDAAHAPGTPFDRAHAALLPAGYVVQPHGFHRDDDDYPDVVLSAGTAPPPPELEAVREAVEGAGFEAGVWAGGDHYESLAATTNRQGVSTREAGGSFVHVELDRDTRTDQESRERLAAALARALRDR